MFTRWTKHLTTEEDKEKYRQQVLSCKPVLDHIKEMIEEDLAALARSEEDQRIYDLPNWEYRQAHKHGIRQYANVIKNLINLDQKEN